LSFQHRSDKILVDAALRIWASALVHQIQANKAASKFYNASLAERAIATWRSTFRGQRRLTRQAKLVRRLFLERMTWRKWKAAIDAKRREEKFQGLEKKRLKAAWKIWAYKARKARNDRRKEDAVSSTIRTRVMRRMFDTWMERVLFIKNREYDVKLEYQEKLTRYVVPCLPTGGIDPISSQRRPCKVAYEVPP
jgi:Sfi1 spindle body protein